jgi:nucleoside-diphosphate-sugar epimerase
VSRVLLAGIPDRLAGPLTEDLGRRHSVRAIDGSVLNVSDCERASACDVVIHGLDATGPESGLIDQATRGIWNLLTTSHTTRFIQLSSMRLYDAYGGGWALDETWAPRPSTTTANLAPYLAEAASREISRSRDIRCIVLRMDDILEPESWEAGAGTGTSLHIDDAIEAIVRAVDVPDQRLGPDRWKAFNIVQGGPSSRCPASRATREVLGFQPNHRARAVA